MDLHVADAAMSVLYTVIGALLGGWLSYKAGLATMRMQSNQEFTSTKDAYLRHLQSEFERNRGLLHRIKKYVGPGPTIENLWGPAKVLASSLQTDAFDALIKAGVLPALSKEDQRLFNIANRTVRDARLSVEETAANWLRIREWEEHDQESNNPQPASLKLAFSHMLPEVTGRIEHAIEMLDKALDSLETTNKEPNE